MHKKNLPPDRILSYFQRESKVLAIITASGLVYNLGLLAGPWFEGRMAETLVYIAAFSDMLTLVCGYITAIALVQGMRYVKRFYVRHFANNVNRRMKETLYGNLVRKSRRELEQEGGRLAGLDEAVGSLEQGLDTPCTPGIFSQGQWQLLSIARAVAADPKLLLLDEITANLDAETEHAVLLALRRASSNRTVISISHRTGADMGRLIPVGPTETA